MSKPAAAVTVSSLADCVPDCANANKGTERGATQLAISLERLGAGRSIVLSADGVILAGNKTAEQAGQLGMERLLVVDSDGTQLVAVRRTDLHSTDAKARELAVADNRISEVGLLWDAEALAQLKLDDIPLDAYFRPDELDALMMQAAEEGGGDGAGEEGEGEGLQAAAKTACCPECGHVFPLTAA